MNILHFLPEFIRRAVASGIAYELGRLPIPADIQALVLAKIDEVLGVQ